MLERHCLALREEVEHLSERQKVLAILMEGEMNMQKTAPEDFQRQIFQELHELEEQKTKGALEFAQRKHKFIKWEGERERARTLQRLGSSRAIGQWSWCDNRCSEKAVRCWQIASLVVEEGGEAHTVNLCQQCHNEQSGRIRGNGRELWKRTRIEGEFGR